MLTNKEVESGETRSAIWRRLIEQWRTEAAKYPDERTCSASEAYEQCADELDAALRACAEAPETTEETKDDQSRSATQADSQPLQSSAPTAGGVSAPAPKRWTDVLCTKCGGNGVIKIPGGISQCPRCDGRCYEPEAKR